MSRTKIIFDGDPGIDDALALLYALKNENAELVGITTVGGNISLDNTTRNALKILEISNNIHIPVAKGIGKPLLRKRIASCFQRWDTLKIPLDNII